MEQKPWQEDLRSQGTSQRLAEQWLYGTTKEKPYAIACAMAYLCKAVNPEHKFTQSIKRLSKEFPTVPLGKYGFPARWESEPLWR